MNKNKGIDFLKGIKADPLLKVPIKKSAVKNVPVKKVVAEPIPTMTIVEVDFFSLKDHAQGTTGETCYNQRVARVAVTDEKLIPFKLREYGFIPEKIIKTRVIEANASPAEVRELEIKYNDWKTEDKAHVERVQKRTGTARKKSTRGKTSYTVSGEGKAFLKSIKSQAEPIAKCFLKTKEPLTIDMIIEQAGSAIKTTANPKAIVAFYVSKWKSKNILIPSN